ncbi:MAG: integrase arm-type DNA-binding domain-containing protein [Rhodospirillales bacterium]|nr:integrase arm-type DNA-binding domain-containing protein [Rhodospirillales bacterium]
MARQLNKLTAFQVKNLKAATKEKTYGDGGGLELKVTKAGTKSWIYRFKIDNKAYNMGLGPYPEVSRSEAREKAAQCRKLRQEGINPKDHREHIKRVQAAKDAKAWTFQQCAEAYVESKEAGWKAGGKTASRWHSTLAAYVYPVFGPLNVAAVDDGLVLKVLDPIWRDKTETASQIRGRIERVIDYAKSRKFYTGENPARWKGHLSNVLPEQSVIAKTKHFPAMPYSEVADFMVELRKKEGFSARALEFAILTADRTSEVLGARWEEISCDEKYGNVWTIPAERMKEGREHRVALSHAAMEVLDAMRQIQTEGYVFPGTKPNRPLSNMCMVMLMRRMGRGDFVPHGFRSTFRDWASEETQHSPEAAELALSHVVGSSVERTYRRGDMLEKRVRLMQDWADYCNGIARSDNVVPLRG